MYFAQDAPRHLATLTTAMLWGYGHYIVFASAAAVGAGLAVNLAHATGHGSLTDHQAAASCTVPIALFIIMVCLLHRRASPRSPRATALHLAAVLAVLAAHSPRYPYWSPESPRPFWSPRPQAQAHGDGAVRACAAPPEPPGSPSPHPSPLSGQPSTIP
ncbi:Bacterial low temperature requirement A protein (LtrA) [Streptomyces sp. ADI93-02]|nr:Bacterial low temperature requirement A protein (LtrA) [Streptomyces sp. ADI93-02]